MTTTKATRSRREISTRTLGLVAAVVLFLVPFSVFLLIIAWDYVAVSWASHEGSREAGGLPLVWLLKSLVLALPVLLLLQYTWFGVEVGSMRGKYEVKAPAISGAPEFERMYRVHSNTMEQLVLFLPADIVLRSNVFCGDAHMVTIKNLKETIHNHKIHQLSIIHTGTPSC